MYHVCTLIQKGDLPTGGLVGVVSGAISGRKSSIIHFTNIIYDPFTYASEAITISRQHTDIAASTHITRI